ncbi:DUF2975 domain-containing protein [Kordia sp. YSTF-M3]|uniref:DUF2975 domain-containing protein n=1 Tax=Kordia aestuariivivens TaxID=2759037 RepID=A0ABR7QF29_9FLAO|nr:DUF2975 domain-containing protein [Kordia aestuariivivens]MBC8757166.1 DUF2975 domain-containing protein [Kordia aestuariivivens]
MNSKTELVLKVMRFLVWLVFIGLLIKAGAIMMSFGVSVNNSEAAKDLYRGMDLSRYESYSFINYTSIVFYHILLNLMQAYIALFVAKLLSSINIEKPFTKTVADLLKRISITVFGVWILAMLHNLHVAILEKYAAITPDYIAVEFIFLAGVVFVLAQLFKKGVEMQTENDLTV